MPPKVGVRPALQSVLLCLRSPPGNQGKDSTSPQAGIQDWLSSLDRTAPLKRIGLGWLLAEDVEVLVDALGIGSSVCGSESAAFNNWLISGTDGHPFYLVETLKSLNDEGLLIPSRSSLAQAIR
jgi:hypothetical protein